MVCLGVCLEGVDEDLVGDISCAYISYQDDAARRYELAEFSSFCLDDGEERGLVKLIQDAMLPVCLDLEEFEGTGLTLVKHYRCRHFLLLSA